MTLFELKEKMAELSASISEDAAWIAEKAADPATPMEEIKKKTAHRDDLQARFDLLKKEHDRQETIQKTAIQQQVCCSEKDQKTRAKAAFYRDALNGTVKKTYEGLGAIPAANADLGNGSKLLPTNVSNELLTEPVEENPLREIEPCTNIKGLEEQKLSFTIEDEKLADVTDQEVAKEIETSGDTIEYGRYKTKITATIKDTVLYGSDHDLVTAVENALRSGLAIKEKIGAFRTVADTTHDHQSFYLTNIKVVEGDTIIDAIINAWADLPEAFSTNASVVMRKTDYYAGIRELANGSEALFGKKPEEVIGIPVKFCEKAVHPVVGDFRFSKQNYDGDAVFETDKDAKKGEYYFVLTAWGDHQIRLKSAFRVAKKKQQPLP